MLIEAREISKIFGSGDASVTAVENISLLVEEGEHVAIVGPSGSGKSTLINILAGLLQPSSGEVVVDGISIYDSLPPDGVAAFRSEYIGFVFQAFHLIPFLNACENVSLPLAHIKLPRREKRRMAEAALEKAGLADRMKHLPSELSGGQQQRVAIARAIVNAPPVLIADEPTGNLDKSTSRQILRLFEALHVEGHTILTVTHDDTTLEYVDRRIEIVDGLQVGCCPNH